MPRRCATAPSDSAAQCGGARDGRWLYFRAALRSGQIGKAPDSGSGDCRFESYLLSQRDSQARRQRRARRWSHRLVVRTPASHVGNAGSTPAGIIHQNRVQTRVVRRPVLLLAIAVLIANLPGCSYLQSTPPPGKIEVQAVSWKLVKKLAEPDAGLSGHKVSVLNPADKNVVASGTTDASGILSFDLPPGTYTLIGASDEPQSVQVQSGQTSSFKIVVH
jgi:hypothetical protein